MPAAAFRAGSRAGTGFPELARLPLSALNLQGPLQFRLLCLLQEFAAKALEDVPVVLATP
jgi:hypothetical protein